MDSKQAALEQAARQMIALHESGDHEFCLPAHCLYRPLRDALTIEQGPALADLEPSDYCYDCVHGLHKHPVEQTAPEGKLQPVQVYDSKGQPICYTDGAPLADARAALANHHCPTCQCANR